MNISSIHLRNFRNFPNNNIYFGSAQINTIIGENASGKTNLFHAIRLLLDDTISFSSRYLSEKDFSKSLPFWAGHWIIITLGLKDLGNIEEEAVLKYIFEDHNPHEGCISLIYRPKLYIRQKLYEISKSDLSDQERKTQSIALLKTLSSDKDHYEVTIRAHAQLEISNTNYAQIAGDFTNYIFPDPSNEYLDIIGNKASSNYSIHSAINCTYIKPLRDVVQEMKYSKKNPLIKLLEMTSKNLENESISNAVVHLNQQIENIDDVKALSKAVQNTLLNTVGNTYSPFLQIGSDIKTDLPSLIKDLKLLTCDFNNEQFKGDIQDLSLGGANLLYLALKLYEFEYYKGSNIGASNFLLIEEPEAHIHNHIQKTLFNNLQTENTQIFLTTHSTHLSSASKISSMTILAKRNEISEAYSPSNGLKPNDVTKIERYLDAVRSTLLFSKAVILVEGDAELILIPHIIKTVFGISLDELGISLISVNGTVFEHLINLFHKDRIKRHCAIITDSDQRFFTDDSPIANKKEKEKAQNSAEKGLERIQKLKESIVENQYVAAFFADHTFEVDLIKHGNNKVFTEMVSEFFQQAPSITDYTEKLSDTDISVSGIYALRLAKKASKGWFAVTMCEHIPNFLIIPDYILQALAHVMKPSYTEKIIHNMFLHYLDNWQRTLSDNVPHIAYIEQIKQYSLENIILYLKTNKHECAILKLYEELIK